MFLVYSWTKLDSITQTDSLAPRALQPSAKWDETLEGLLQTFSSCGLINILTLSLPFAPLLHNKFMCTYPYHNTCRLLIQMLNLDCGSSLCQSVVCCYLLCLLKSTIILISAGDLDAAAFLASLWSLLEKLWKYVQTPCGLCSILFHF